MEGYLKELGVPTCGHDAYIPEKHLLAVRAVTLEGEPWFVAADVCRALGIGDSRTATARLDADEKGAVLIRTLGGEQKVTIISESGLYALVLSSRKPEAKAFKRWITHEVIPQDRRLHCRSGDDNTDLVT